MRRLFTFLLCGIVVLPQAVCGTAFADGSAELNLTIGDYLQLGKYNDEPILWRYVADDEHGKLILSDKVICKKSYDNFTEKISGSHSVPSRAKIYASPLSNYWGDSNIRSWLNSKAPAREVNWLCGNLPPYRNEKGFLADGNFTQSERMLVKKVKQKTLLDEPDAGYAVGGDPKYWGARFDGTGDFVRNRYDNICYEYTNDMVFLPSIKQLYDIIQNSDLLGADYIAPEVAKSYYLRTPYGYYTLSYSSPFSSSVRESGDRVMTVRYEQHSTDKSAIEHIYSAFESGIRPAFYLNEINASILSGCGTESDPYILAGKPGTEKMEDGAIGTATYDNPIGISIFVNGEKTWFPHDLFMEDDRIFASLLWIEDSMNTHMYDYTERITGHTDNDILTMYIDSNTVTLNNNEQIEWDAAPKRINGYAYLPLRAFAEAMGAEVE